MNVLDWFRGVVWPHRPKDKLYRYVIVGMLVTEKPIEEFEGKNQILFDGRSCELRDSLVYTKHKVSNIPLGDASQVLVSLNYGMFTDQFEDEDEGR